MNWVRNPAPTYCIANPIGSWVGSTWSEQPTSFTLVPTKSRSVAGYEGVQLTFYFVYSDDGTEANANLYAGRYSFYDDNVSFDDLFAKLSSVYGEPSQNAEDIMEVWGDNFSEEVYQNFCNDYPDAAFHIATWKSSTNGAVVVLSEYNIWNSDRPTVELFYLYPPLTAASSLLKTTSPTAPPACKHEFALPRLPCEGGVFWRPVRLK